MTEQNQIHNSGLKSQIADAAISYLLSRKLLSEQELSGLELEFGYVFLTEQGAVEALLRLAVRNGQDKPPCFYFALQQGRLIHVKLEEDQFRLYVETMPEMHPCLRREGPEQSRAQLQRRQRSIAALEEQGIACSRSLPCLHEDSRAQVKPLEEVLTRAIACFVAVQISCDLRNGLYQKSRQFFDSVIEALQLREHFTEQELRIIDNRASQQDLLDLDWAYECFWALCWYLGLVPELRDAASICDCSQSVKLYMLLSGPKGREACKPRSLEELLDMEDLYLRYHWALNEHSANPEAPAGQLEPSVVLERRRALEWLISEQRDWDAIPLFA